MSLRAQEVAIGGKSKKRGRPTTGPRVYTSGLVDSRGLFTRGDCTERGWKGKRTFLLWQMGVAGIRVLPSSSSSELTSSSTIVLRMRLPRLVEAFTFLSTSSICSGLNSETYLAKGLKSPFFSALSDLASGPNRFKSTYLIEGQHCFTLRGDFSRKEGKSKHLSCDLEVKKAETSSFLP